MIEIDMEKFSVIQIKLPPTVRLNDQEVATSELSEPCKKILADLIKIDEELADLEFQIRKTKASKAELQRLLTVEHQKN